jgi:hypothetical protein
MTELKSQILAFIVGKIANPNSKIANKKIPNLSIQDSGAQIDFSFQLSAVVLRDDSNANYDV